MIDEVLQLGDIGLAEPLHEPRHGVVSHAVFVHHHYRRLAQITDFDRALRAQNLGADVIAVHSVARQVDHAQRASLEGQVDYGVVYVADLVDFGIGEHAAVGVSALDFAHHPSRDVDVVNAHVDDQAAAVIRIQVFQARPERVARRRLEDYRLADHAVFYLLLSGAKAAIESAHEAHMEEDSGLVNNFLYRARLVERDGERLFAKDGKAGARGGGDDVVMRTGRRDDDDGVNLLVVNQVLIVRIPLGYADLSGDCFRGRVGVRGGEQV